MKKKVIVCVQKDIKNTVSWALKDLSVVNPQYLDHLHQVEKILESPATECGIIIDSKINNESSIPLLYKIKDKSKMRILLIVSSDMPKEEIVSLIKERKVDNVVVRPFNAKQLVDALAKICGIERPSEKAWYEYTKPS